MNGIVPTQPPSRSAPNTDTGTGKVTASTATRDESASQQNSAHHNSVQQGQGQKAGDTGADHRGHSDPAISLSASLARLDPGATLKGSVVGFDASEQPIIKTPQGVFVLNADGLKAALKLVPNSQIELRISAIDHVIEAQLTAKDGTRLDPPLRLTLTLVGLAPDAAKLVAKTGPETLVQAYTLPVSTASGNIGQNVVAEDSAVFATIRNAGSALSASPAASAESPAVANLAPNLAKPTGTVPNTSLLPVADQLVAQQVNAATPPVAATAKSVPSAQIQSILIPGNEVPATFNAVSAGPTSIPVSISTSISAATIPVAVRLAVIAIHPPQGTTEPARISFTPDVAANIDTTGPTKPDQLAAGRQSASVVIPSKSAPPDQLRVKAEVMGPAAPRPSVSAPSLAASRLTPTLAPTLTSTQAGQVAPELSPELLLRTSAGIIRLAVTKADIAALPPGTKLDIALTREPTTRQSPSSQKASILSPAPSPTAPVPPSATSPEMRPLAGYLEQWPTIDDILVATGAIDPALASLVMGRIATPTHQMGTKTIFLLNLLGLNQSAEKWLGPKATEALKQAGRNDLIARLGDDFHRIASLGRDHNSNDWRPVLLPFHDGRETQGLPVLIRQFKDPSADRDMSGQNTSDHNDGKNATRFVIDVSLSRLGNLQMDGMIKSRRFTLIMRSEHPLNDGIRSEISHIFSSALNRNHFDGEVVFQPGTPFPLSAAAFMNDATVGKSQGNFYA